MASLAPHNKKLSYKKKKTEKLKRTYLYENPMESLHQHQRSKIYKISETTFPHPFPLIYTQREQGIEW